MIDYIFSFCSVRVNGIDMTVFNPCIVNCAKFMFDPAFNTPLPADLKISEGLEAVGKVIRDPTEFILNDSIPLDAQAEAEKNRLIKVFEFGSQIDIQEEIRRGLQQVDRPRLTDRGLNAVDMKNRLTAFKIYIINPTEAIGSAIMSSLSNEPVNFGFQFGTDRLVQIQGEYMTYIDFDGAFNDLISHVELDNLDIRDDAFPLNRARAFREIAEQAAEYQGPHPRAEIRIP